MQASAEYAKLVEPPNEDNTSAVTSTTSTEYCSQLTQLTN